MLMTGKDYLESIRDGRRVYVGSELVEDVTTHPAFRNAAHSFALIYDRKRAPENHDIMTFEEDGEPSRRTSCCRARVRICSAGSRPIDVSPGGRTACSAARPTTSPAT
jgi:4-hydroxyphenylacetate 3-hydroxylase N terminal